MDIRDLQFFCLTVEMEHVTKTAEKLGVAQPFLTKVIRKLEEEIGASLFDKVGRNIKLNERGKIFYMHAKKILTELENLNLDMEKSIQQCIHTIKIMTNTEIHYFEIVMAYQKSNPDFTLAISTASRKEILNSLRTGEADFGICSPPLIDEPGDRIITDIVFCERCCIMLPPSHPMLKKKVVGFADLIGEPLITTLKESALRLNLDKLMEKYNYRPHIVCESNDINLIIRAVKSGLGFAILPRSVMFSIPSIRKYCVEAALTDTFGVVGLSYRTERCSLLRESEFLEFIKKFTLDYYEDYYLNDL